MENLWVALTNLPAVYPIRAAIQHNDAITAWCLMFVSLFSFSSHLVENHKHGMPGIGVSKYTSWVLNRFDVLGCILVFLRVAWLCWAHHARFPWLLAYQLVKDWGFLLQIAISFGLSRISEYDHYNPDLKRFYIVTHSLWHISIFLVINKFLLKYIYPVF